MRKIISKTGLWFALASAALLGQDLFGQSLNVVNPHRAQSSGAGRALPEQFQVNLTDRNGNAVAGQTVTFTAPGSGPTGTFTDGTSTATVVTDNAGNATAPVFTPGTVVGPTSSFYEIVAAAGAASTKLYVANCLSGTPIVVSAADAGPGTLRDVVGNACDGAVIAFALPKPSTIFLTSGTISNYRLPATGLDVVLPINVSILGPGQDSLTIDGGNLIRPFQLGGTIQARPIFVANLTIANGRGIGGSGQTGGGGAAGVGGGLVNLGFLTLANVRFQGNTVVGGSGSQRITSGAAGGGGGTGGDGLPWRTNTAGGFGGNGGPGAIYGPADIGGAGGLEAPPSAGGSALYSGGGGGGSQGFAGGDGAAFGGGGGAGFNLTSPPSGGKGGPYGGGSGAGSVSTPGLYGGSGGLDDSTGLYASGGGGGGLGGAILNLGALHLANVSFVSNRATAGPAGGIGSHSGQAKGGAIVTFDGLYLSTYGPPVFQGNTATDAGAGTACPGVDSQDLCGVLNTVPGAGAQIPTGNDKLVLLTGSPQTASPGGSFSIPIAVKLFNDAVPFLGTYVRANYPVTFTLPTSGAGGTFARGLTSFTVPTDDNGIATAPQITTNTTAGAFIVTASIGNLTVPITVSNGLPAGSAVTLAGGTPQQTAAGQAFAARFQVLVKDANNQPLPGASIVFAAPASGASGSFSTGGALATVITDSSGLATAPQFSANYWLGSYVVTASVANSTISFSLTNTLPAGSTLTVASGNSQNVAVGTAYLPLTAVLRDSAAHGLQGASVRLAAPANGASFLFSGGSSSQAIITDASGSAVSSVPAANYAVGSFTVTATYAALSANFTETNAVPGNAGFAITGGNAQTTTSGQAFAQPLQVTLTDGTQHGIAASPVVFTIPAGGSPGTFAGGATSVTIQTNSLGVALSPTVTSNTTPGSFTVSASTAGRSVTFTLGSFSPSASALDIEAGSPQTTGTGVPFGSALIVRLHTQGGVSLPGIPITFTAPATGASGLFANPVAPSNTATVITDAGGRAISPVFTANMSAGSYIVTANALSLTSNFNLTNAGPGTLTPVPNHTISTVTFVTIPFGVLVKNADGTPFKDPSNCTFLNVGDPNCYFVNFKDNRGSISTIPPDSSGLALIPFQTFDPGPGLHSVIATVLHNPGGASASTALYYNIITSWKFPQLFIYNVQTIAPGSGGVPLQVPVVDDNSNPVFGVPVRFDLPANSGLSFSGSSSVTIYTNIDGIAISPPFGVKTGVTVPTGQVLATATTNNQSISLPIQLNSTGSVRSAISVQALDSLFSTRSSSRFNLTLTPSSATGQVTIFDNGNPVLTRNLPLGNFSYQFTAVGTHTIFAEYFGDANNSPAFSAPLTLSANDVDYAGLFGNTVVTQQTNDGNGASRACYKADGFNIGVLVQSTCTNNSNNNKQLARSLAVVESTPLTTNAASTSAAATLPVPVFYATGPGPHAVVFGDFDGDGGSDLLVTNSGNSTITFLKSTGTSFNPAMTFAVPSVPGPIVTGDFNHDGALDFAYGTSGGSVVIGLNIGNGNFTLLPGLAVGGSVAALSAPDLNGDGFVDLLVADGSTGQIKAFLNDKNGALLPVTVISQAGAQPRALLTADFNQDGKTDVAVAYYAENSSDSSGKGTVAILLGRGDGTFQSPTFLSGGRPVSLAIGQFEGHTALDLVVASDTGSQIQIYYGKGDGTFAAPIAKSVGSNPSSVLVGDFDGDGRTDISTSSPSASTVSYLFGAAPAIPIVPTIQWSKPADIPAGTPLSATQLNATAVNGSGLNIPGTFAYTPAIGAVLPAGNNQTLSVRFTPADVSAYSPVNGSTTINVKAVYSAAISILVDSATVTYPLGANIKTCVARATSATPTGTVQILDGATVLKVVTLGGDGCAYWYISPGLNAGTHALQASYSGDSKNPAGISAPVTLTVNPAPTYMSVACWNVIFPYGADFQCTLNVSSTAGTALGSIAYTYDGGSATTIPLNGGNAQFKITKPLVGAHNINVSFVPQPNYAATAPKTQSFTVTPAPVVVALTPSSYNFRKGTRLTLQAAVTSWSAGTPNAIGSVSFYDGNTLLGKVPVDASGKASFSTTTLTAGVHTIKATYAEGANYDTGSSIAIIIVNP